MPVLRRMHIQPVDAPLLGVPAVCFSLNRPAFLWSVIAIGITLWKLRRADLQARGRLVEEGLANQAAAEARFQREIDRAVALKVTDLAIRGEDVMRELRVGPGRQVGRVLAGLLDRVIDDPDLNTRETLLRLLPEVARKLSTGNPQ